MDTRTIFDASDNRSEREQSPTSRVDCKLELYYGFKKGLKEKWNLYHRFRRCEARLAASAAADKKENSIGITREPNLKSRPQPNSTLDSCFLRIREHEAMITYAYGDTAAVGHGYRINYQSLGQISEEHFDLYAQFEWTKHSVFENAVQCIHRRRILGMHYVDLDPPLADWHLRQYRDKPVIVVYLAVCLKKLASFNFSASNADETSNEKAPASSSSCGSSASSSPTPTYPRVD
ncbi:hypothetical protein F4778DRAFT_15268 [Xylariomycetidae sp. FL2044]|nr:hypothetical protein F4778DRAFT_15268 [Xylariomycetidae sp. FL2044]